MPENRQETLHPCIGRGDVHCLAFSFPTSNHYVHSNSYRTYCVPATGQNKVQPRSLCRQTLGTKLWTLAQPPSGRADIHNCLNQIWRRQQTMDGLSDRSDITHDLPEAVEEQPGSHTDKPRLSQISTTRVLAIHLPTSRPRRPMPLLGRAQVLSVTRDHRNSAPFFFFFFLDPMGSLKRIAFHSFLAIRA
jgi:hypothetical protein